MERERILAHLGPSVEPAYPLAKLTSLKVGGPADFFAVARTEEAMVDLVRKAWSIDLPVFIMGNGSNILLADKGIRGLVIRNMCVAVRYQPTSGGKETENRDRQGSGNLLVSAQSGAMLPRIAHEAIRLGFHDLVFATGIPGTVGGAVLSNAGAYGWTISDSLLQVRFVARSGEVRTWPKEQLDLRYRHSRFKETGEIVLAADLLLEKRDSDVKAPELNRKRRETQPLTMPNAGSMFKNPPGSAAGLLIEQAGLKGKRIGNAQISEKHGNFIVNLGGARAQEVLELVQLAQRSVTEPLELEVQLVGEWS